MFGAGSSPLTRGKPPCAGRRGVASGLIPAHAGKTRVKLMTACAHAAHPRSRGENKLKWHPSDTKRGLIPAHAGKTIPTNRRQYLSGAHPRSRGENRTTQAHSQHYSGSSPLTRGKHPRCARCRPSRGLIPAHAGKTDIESLEGFTNGAHPRSRGENQLAKVHASRQSGSSPLTRGKRVPFGVVVVVVGLIPAHAGKTATPHGGD